ncbi:MAG: chemotaxis response regulator protein-glutamate methylesterase [Alphaproteobacteria bacterium]|nr:chemotaxis response regulator protein-glutamate methylesterase [Alphaproteobacteria bacterium]
MLVDDSAVIRGLLTRSLETDPQVRVMCSAANGVMALRALERNDVEVVVLDIEMPEMDGLTALPLLLKRDPALKVIMASTLTRKNAEVSMRALDLGASDYLAKPTSTTELNSATEFKRQLVEKVKALGAVRRRQVGGATPRREVRPVVAPPPRKPPGNTPFTLRSSPPVVPMPDIIAIGSSTGGPQALMKVLGDIKGGLGQPILITQHMPATFTTILAEHISRASGIKCAEAVDGEPIVGGRIYLAPGDYHMVVEGSSPKRVVRLNQAPPENFCRPAVDPMMRSIVKSYGARVLAVILTGMGADGRSGCDEVVKAGGIVVAQDEASSVVWGMPGAVATAGLCTAVLPVGEIGTYVRRIALRTAA